MDRHWQWIRGFGVLLAGLCLLTAGCMGDAVKQVQQAAQQTRKAATRAEATQQLRSLGISYLNYHDAYHQGPPGWEEFKEFEAKSGGSPQIMDQLRELGYTVIWNCQFKNITIGISNFVVAYPADASSNGGVVLLLDGSVRTMSAQEFQEAMTNQASVTPPQESSPAAGPGAQP